MKDYYIVSNGDVIVSKESEVESFFKTAYSSDFKYYPLRWSHFDGGFVKVFGALAHSRCWAEMDFKEDGTLYQKYRNWLNKNFYDDTKWDILDRELGDSFENSYDILYLSTLCGGNNVNYKYIKPHIIPHTLLSKLHNNYSSETVENFISGLKESGCFRINRDSV